MRSANLMEIRIRIIRIAAPLRNVQEFAKQKQVGSFFLKTLFLGLLRGSVEKRGM